jgi:hypothetical protein
MEKTRYGVKTSILEELKSFQLELKKHRKMLFEVTMTGNVGPPVQRTLMTGEGRASILNFTYPFVVGREDYSEIGELEISLIIDQSIQYNIKFQYSAIGHNLNVKYLDWTTPSPPRES